MSNTLFDWSERNQTQAEPRPAEILVFPMTRHVVVNELARKFVKHADEKVDEGIKKEAVKILRKRLHTGVPERVAAKDAGNLYRAVWSRILSLRHTKLETGA